METFNALFDKMVNTSENISEQFINQYKNSDKKIVLYGCGHACEYFYNYLHKRGIKIAACVDKNKTGNFRDIPIFSFEQLRKELELEDCVFVISAPSLRKEIKKYLLNYVNENQVYDFEVELYEYYNTSYEQYKKFLIENRERLYHTYKMWEDDYSREVMMRVLEGRLTGNLDVIDSVWEENQYWPENVIQFSKEEVIVECGSSDGNTLLSLCEQLADFNHIYCFEPDKDCLPYLENAVSKLSKKDEITIVKKGTYREKGVLHFCAKGVESGLSVIAETGSLQIEVTTIDEEVERPVTYIKMDIEGAELDTLYGAQKTIREMHPKLAVCVYHKDEDMVNIPEYLYSLNPQYKFYLRHHNCNMTETVLYAVPSQEI